MLRLSDLIGMRIISQTTGNNVALIHSPIVDKANRRVAALLVEAEGVYGDCRAVCWSAIRSVGDVMMVEGRDPLLVLRYDAYLLRLMQQSVPLIGTPVLCGSATPLGLVSDVFIEIDGSLIGLQIGGGFWSLRGARFVPADQLLAISRDGILSRTSQLLPLTALHRFQRRPAAPVEVLEQALPSLTRRKVARK